MRGLILTAALGAALGGCYTTGEVGYSATYSTTPAATYAAPSGDVYATTPDLVAVSPGVQVVADYDEPVFFTDGFYWRFYDGYWYRSNNYYSGWYFYERPPVAVLRIDRPYAYAHYRPSGYVGRRNVRYRAPERITVDRRAPVYAPPAARPGTYGPPARAGVYAPPAAAPSAPVVRDHRGAPPAAAPPAAAPPAAAAPPPAAAPVVRDHRHPPAKDSHEHRR